MIDIVELKRLVEVEGKLDKEIAAIFGCSRPNITKLVNKLGLKRKKNTINVEELKRAALKGESFSSFARRTGFSLSSVSKAAKEAEIKPPGTNHLPKLAQSELLVAYKNGKSLHCLHLESGVPVNTLKRQLRRLDPNIVFRTRDEAIRPALLNNREAFAIESSEKSYRQIAKELGVNVCTVTRMAKKYGLKFEFSRVWSAVDYHDLLDLYVAQGKWPSEISTILGYPYNVVLRQLKRFGFPINSSGGYPRKSKYPELDDPAWLNDQYTTYQRSINQIARSLQTSPRNVLYHLRKHNIKLRTKSEYLKLLMDHLHGCNEIVVGIKCDSQLEADFLKSIPETAVISRNIELSSNGSYCFIDFEVDGELYEIKPNGIKTQHAVNRRRAVKQMKICERNNRKVTMWTKSGPWDQRLSDDDIYYAMNWKLFFDSASDCSYWLLKKGFEAPRYSTLELVHRTHKLAYCKVGHELNANFQNDSPSIFTSHFFPHFWQSTHKDYIPVSDAWSAGNTSVLKRAVGELWEEKKEVNIYGLVRIIRHRFKDFATVSIFKPWIAKYIYSKYLQDGGTVIDPSCGWGGRFIGTMGSKIKYIGYDLNLLSIDSHNRLREFFGNRVTQQPEFICADSSCVDFADGDLLFTSPPYDDTELYAGINSNETTTLPILENIFNKFSGHTIVLNLPKRLENQCLSVSGRWKLVETLQMKTGSFMGREKTYEPILVFK